jgi:hypothetical protein
MAIGIDYFTIRSLSEVWFDLFDYLFARSAKFFFEKIGIKEIIQLEQANKEIILHKEGLFWRAYEQSAYYFYL